ncbi:hypothetical protein J6590_105210 [Homalodisca vitripennis]|nr:hypothetical protein J6590_105210 [Homalodisca vitripennis]
MRVNFEIQGIPVRGEKLEDEKTWLETWQTSHTQKNTGTTKKLSFLSYATILDRKDVLRTCVELPYSYLV